jgi:hypothetical protein
MDRAGAPAWLFRFAATFLLLWAACWAAPRLFANLPQFPPTTTDQMQVDVFDRYFRLPAQGVVLVGSSLSYRLKEQYFEHGDVRNAAINGGSPLTGMAIIAAAPSARPRVIAVETNVLDRTIDKDLLEQFKNAKRPEDTLRPLRSLAAYYQGAKDDAITYGKARIRAIVARPPAPDLAPGRVAEASGEWNEPTRREAMARGAAALGSLVENLQAEGVAIFFYEVPYPSQLDHSLYATMAREALAKVVSPDDKRRLMLEYPAEELRWNADGIHLDDRSAVIFAAALDDAIHKKLTGQHSAGAP